jgi:hypothetical protein
MNNAFDPIPKVESVEINQDSQLLSAELQVGDDLRLMNGCETVDHFNLDDHKIFHHHIKPVADIQPDLPIDKGQRYLGKDL